MALLDVWPISQHPVLAVAAALLLTLILRQIYQRILEERKISALGGHAAARTSWIPFGISLVYRAVKYTKRHQDFVLWDELFTKYGNPGNPWTVEIRIAGLRIIQTADEENIKAILATQFAEFGKGKRFNEEWHDFLGDSMWARPTRLCWC